MLSALYWVALLGVVLQVSWPVTCNTLTTWIQLAPDGQAQHLPREIEEGPDGSIVINLGGVPDPRASGFNSPGLALLRAVSFQPKHRHNHGARYFRNHVALQRANWMRAMDSTRRGQWDWKRGMRGRRNMTTTATQQSPRKRQWDGRGNPKKPNPSAPRF